VKKQKAPAMTDSKITLKDIAQIVKVVSLEATTFIDDDYYEWSPEKVAALRALARQALSNNERLAKLHMAAPSPKGEEPSLMLQEHEDALRRSAYDTARDKGDDHKTALAKAESAVPIQPSHTFLYLPRLGLEGVGGSVGYGMTVVATNLHQLPDTGCVYTALKTTQEEGEMTPEKRAEAVSLEFAENWNAPLTDWEKESVAKAIRDARNETLEEAAKWHDDQCQGGHCGEGSSEIIMRQRRNRWHDEAATAIRSLKEKGK